MGANFRPHETVAISLMKRSLVATSGQRGPDVNIPHATTRFVPIDRDCSPRHQSTRRLKKTSAEALVGKLRANRRHRTPTTMPTMGIRNWTATRGDI